MKLTEFHFRYNVKATERNWNVPGGSQHANVFPLMNHEGHFPSDFQMAKTVDLVRVLDSKYFRILFIYIVIVSYTLGSSYDLHDRQRNSFSPPSLNFSHPFIEQKPHQKH